MFTLDLEVDIDEVLRSTVESIAGKVSTRREGRFVFRTANKEEEIESLAHHMMCAWLKNELCAYVVTYRRSLYSRRSLLCIIMGVGRAIVSLRAPSPYSPA